MLLQTFDDFIVERGKFSDLILENFFDILLSELAEIVQANEAFPVPAGHALLDELELASAEPIPRFVQACGDFGFLQTWQMCVAGALSFIESFSQNRTAAACLSMLRLD